MTSTRTSPRAKFVGGGKTCSGFLRHEGALKSCFCQGPRPAACTGRCDLLFACSSLCLVHRVAKPRREKSALPLSARRGRRREVASRARKAKGKAPGVSAQLIQWRKPILLWVSAWDLQQSCQQQCLREGIACVCHSEVWPARPRGLHVHKAKPGLTILFLRVEGSPGQVPFRWIGHRGGDRTNCFP